MSSLVRRALAVAATVLVALGGLGGCSRKEFADRSAVVVVGDARTTFDIDSCGRDGRTIYVVGRAEAGGVVQAVMDLRRDKATAVRSATGMTFDVDASSDDTRVAAFGPVAWRRRGGTGAPPGRIDSARLRGSRVQFDGQVQALDAQDRPVPGADPQHFSFDARCDLPGT